MSQFKTILGTFVVCSALSAPALAGEHSAAAGAELPKEVAAMECMVGEWTGPIEMKMGDQTVDLKASMSCKRSSGGHAVSCKSRIDGLPSGPVHETDLFGYNAQDGKYHWYAVTSMGEVHDHVAEVPKSSTVSFVYRDKVDGKPYVEAIDLTFSKDKKGMVVKNRTTHGGATLFQFKGKLRKP